MPRLPVRGAAARCGTGAAAPVRVHDATYSAPACPCRAHSVGIGYVRKIHFRNAAVRTPHNGTYSRGCMLNDSGRRGRGTRGPGGDSRWRQQRRRAPRQAPLRHGVRRPSAGRAAGTRCWRPRCAAWHTTGTPNSPCPGSPRRPATPAVRSTTSSPARRRWRQRSWLGAAGLVGGGRPGTRPSPARMAPVIPVTPPRCFSRSPARTPSTPGGTWPRCCAVCGSNSPGGTTRWARRSTRPSPRCSPPANAGSAAAAAGARSRRAHRSATPPRRWPPPWRRCPSRSPDAPRTTSPSPSAPYEAYIAALTWGNAARVVREAKAL